MIKLIIGVCIIAIVMIAGYGLYNVLTIGDYTETLFEGEKAIENYMSENKG